MVFYYRTGYIWIWKSHANDFHSAVGVLVGTWRGGDERDPFTHLRPYFAGIKPVLWHGGIAGMAEARESMGVGPMDDVRAVFGGDGVRTRCRVGILAVCGLRERVLRLFPS